ncbi:UDP-N-acetylmuramoyl-tripeptide--D-alanyl-D-alanine ligase [Patescibacteria group bacterium]|nr:UDP-N-acetylmuramoyl-tripeptide--D-alanyl-D-alanine ligase [Patescibacteria group bacterium]
MKLLKTHLHIYQLEGYQPKRFLNWWLKHPFTHQVSNKTPLVYTAKTKIFIFLSYLILLTSIFISPWLFLIFLIQPFLLLFISTLIRKPDEFIIKWLTIKKTRQQLLNQPQLITIGITGSYGKTTTKDMLFNILNNHQPTLKTPKSYNTIFGIAKVVNLELTNKLKYFICEMGAYVKGEIKTLCYQVPPQYAILTAIGTQHLERFKTIKNTTLAKFELVNAVNPKNAMVNIDNPHIKNHLIASASFPRRRESIPINTYSFKDPKATFFVSKFKLSPQGTSFTLKTKNKSHRFTTPLFGTANLENLAAAISMAIMLKVPVQIIKDSVSKLTPSPNRLELKKIGNATIIDNSYSSNQEGFKKIMTDLSKLPGKKALITPGIVELGQKTTIIHQELGQQANKIFNTIKLIGQSNRTQAFKSTAPHSQILPASTPVWSLAKKLSLTHSWVLIENDLPDNY